MKGSNNIMKKGIIIILALIIGFVIIVSMGDDGSSSTTSYGQDDKNYTTSYLLSSNKTEDNLTSSSKEQSAVNSTKTQPVKMGIYTFKNKKDGQYLSFSKNSLTLESTPKKWELKLKSNNNFQIYGDKSTNLIDVDNAYIASGTTIKMWQNTGYDTQLWKIAQNNNGTYSILCASDESYCLEFKNGSAALGKRQSGNQGQEWIVTEQKNSTYKTYISKSKIIELQISSNITSVISDSRLTKWVNDLETAYNSYYELTNFKPYETIIIVAYKNCTEVGYAYVIDNSNIIHIDKDLLVDDLKKMKARDNDWNFCALHEMGHMFDCNRAWNFEAEVLTDLKVAYVLEKNSAPAAPAEFDAATNFYGKNIINAYSTLGSDFSTTYDIYALAHRFLKIKNDIGWEPFKQTFHKLQSQNSNYATASKQQRFETFISLLSSFSGKNIQSYFTQSEWKTIINKTNSQ